MSTNSKRRGILASAGALLTAAALAFGGATAAQAAAQPIPQSSGLVITKLEQPATAGAAAPGTPQTVPGVGIAGVKFEAYSVPVAGTAGTLTWQANIASTTLPQAQTAIGISPTAIRTGVTDANGVIRWQTGEAGSQGADLPWGLYVIRETATPANVVPAGDFLVAVPLTDPTNRDAWLADIYVYPKNAKVDATKSVDNASQFVVGNTVTWTIDTAIPRVRANGGASYIATDAFEIHDTLQDNQLALDEVAPATGITVTAPAGLTKGASTGAGDYYVVTTSATGQTTYEIVFTASGRQKLADALNNGTGTRVTVTITTKVLAAGTIANAADVYPSQKSITDKTPLTTDPAEIKYGTYALNKKSSDANVTNLAGAQFKVYLTEDDAKNDVNALKPAVTSTGYDPATGIWTTAANGTVSITGLRYSDFANGATLTSGLQTYWLAEVKALEGHQLLSAPISFTVNDASATNTTAIVNQKNGNGFVLPLTGGAGTTFLTVGGIALLGFVLLLIVRRRRHEAAAE